MAPETEPPVAKPGIGAFWQETSKTDWSGTPGGHFEVKAVLVNIFGRETLVEMDFGQVSKL